MVIDAGIVPWYTPGGHIPGSLAVFTSFSRLAAARKKITVPYIGMSCDKHPELKGQRASNGQCAECRRDSLVVARQKRAFKAKESRFYLGKICMVHPELTGKRYTATGRCPLCSRATTYKAREKSKLNPEWRRKQMLRARAQRKTQRRHMPPWADIRKILAVYAEARRLGLTVDHIVPLLGENVCGLHVHYNLRTVTRSVNSAKGNRHKGDLSES